MKLESNTSEIYNGDAHLLTQNLKGGKVVTLQAKSDLPFLFSMS